MLGFVTLAVQLLKAGVAETSRTVCMLINGSFAAYIQSQPWHQMPVAEFPLANHG